MTFKNCTSTSACILHSGPSHHVLFASRTFEFATTDCCLPMAAHAAAKLAAVFGLSPKKFSTKKSCWKVRERKHGLPREKAHPTKFCSAETTVVSRVGWPGLTFACLLSYCLICQILSSLACILWTSSLYLSVSLNLVKSSPQLIVYSANTKTFFRQ